MEVYQVVDSYDGKDKLFEDKDDAKAYKKQRKIEIHQTYCIDKVVPKRCLCDKGDEECAAHEYARTVERHTRKECVLVNGSVWIEIKEIE